MAHVKVCVLIGRREGVKERDVLYSHIFISSPAAPQMPQSVRAFWLLFRNLTAVGKALKFIASLFVQVRGSFFSADCGWWSTRLCF